MDEIKNMPEYLFETSWEVCNKVGGIHTVISTKALNLVKELGDNLILIGPDIWRDSRVNNEFLEDKSLYKLWKATLQEEGIRIKIGRWNIPGRPLVFLVDFTPFISKKDEIFSRFWETYRLDSLSGQWDYIEPALFGYAAAKVIESFCLFNLSVRTRVVAQFHEWMTGTGILYLKKEAPQITTSFTTHATVLGRAIAGNNQPLYGKIATYNPDDKAREFNVVAKQSLEKISAQVADCATTVSGITATECLHFLGKEVDVITPNGFEEDFVPKGNDFDAKRKTARESLIRTAGLILNEKLNDDCLIIGTSGRYEFKNKGIDVFINALGHLNQNPALQKTVLAFITIPANHYGPRKDILEVLESGENKPLTGSPYLTHYLHDADFDPILNHFKINQLHNQPNDKVKVFFVPCYLNGEDGLFNLHYYNLLIGFDLSIYASYYEPWGYTPLESIAFHVPTITTSLSGFGQWALTKQANLEKGVEVVTRTDDNDNVVSMQISEIIARFSRYSESQLSQCRQNAVNLSGQALWNHLLQHYKNAYAIALSKIEERKELLPAIKQTETRIVTDIQKSNKPQWRKMIIESNLPENLKTLDEIARNIWWTWNYDAIELFESIDPVLWEKHKKNALLILKEVSQERINELENDTDFIAKLLALYEKFNRYMSETPPSDQPKIAYFSMEYGLNDIIKIYSGGLGILAGDYLKEASDTHTNMIGIGLLYRFGYFSQQLSLNGEQMVTLEPQIFSELPITAVRDEAGILLTISIDLPGRVVKARVWRVDVGRIPLYLLDTDFDENNEQDRTITHQLYGGDWENRLKQEILLGFGGVRVIESLNIRPDLYHINEGHAAFLTIERISNLILKYKFSFDEAIEIVRASSLFTTHTPVPAGHDKFSEDLIRIYLRHLPEQLAISWDRFLNLGKEHPGANEKFSMSVLAANTCQEMNGVSWLHGKVTRDMFVEMFDGYTNEELYINYVTNGVHFYTWTATEWQKLYDKKFDADFHKNLSNKDHWRKIYDVPDEEIWEIRQTLRKKLVDYIETRFKEYWIKRHENPAKIIDVVNKFNEHTLTFGFARRFATYKRAHLLFHDLDRLNNLINNPKMPVQFLFAGKAHPADQAGQNLIRHIVDISKRPEFIGKIIFLENYDIELAKRLVKGVDVWLNTPTRPLEASGTSGMKAQMNGVLNFSVLDGWWVEGYKKGAGWALPKENTYDNANFQDELDAVTIYEILENEIIPLFYKRNRTNVPVEWIKYIKNSFAQITPDFTTKRMIDDYKNRYYTKLWQRTKQMAENNFEMAIKLSSWKRKVSRGWDSIEVVSVDFPNTTKRTFKMGEDYHGEVVLDLKELRETEVGVELVLTQDRVSTCHTEELKLTKMVDTLAFYKIELKLTRPGIFDYGIRIFPKHKDLPHRQDFNFVKWIS